MTNLVKSFTYGEDLAENTAVKFSEEGVVVQAETATDGVCGITLFTGKAGVKGDVLMFGLGNVSCSGTCEAGDLLVASEAGKLEVLDVTQVSGQVTVVAKVLETASSDAVLSAFVNPQITIIA